MRLARTLFITAVAVAFVTFFYAFSDTQNIRMATTYVHTYIHANMNIYIYMESLWLAHVIRNPNPKLSKHFSLATQNQLKIRRKLQENVKRETMKLFC